MVWALRAVAGLVLAGSSAFFKDLVFLGLPTPMHDFAGARHHSAVRCSRCMAFHAVQNRTLHVGQQ
jgi:hypothetical protein